MCLKIVKIIKRKVLKHLTRKKFHKFNCAKIWSVVAPFVIFFVLMYIEFRFSKAAVVDDLIDFVNSIVPQYISRDVLFWTFSTIVQSFVAFVALLGMVTIYRMQVLSADTRNLSESMRQTIWAHRGPTAVSYPTNKIIKDIKGLAQKYTDDNTLKRADLEFSNFEKEKNSIKKGAKFFFYSTIPLLIFSLILLPMSLVLADTDLGLLFLWIAIFWSSASFILGLNLLKGLLRWGF